MPQGGYIVAGTLSKLVRHHVYTPLYVYYRSSANSRWIREEAGWQLLQPIKHDVIPHRKQSKAGQIALEGLFAARRSQRMLIHLFHTRLARSAYGSSSNERIDKLIRPTRHEGGERGEVLTTETSPRRSAFSFFRAVSGGAKSGDG